MLIAAIVIYSIWIFITGKASIGEFIYGVAVSVFIFIFARTFLTLVYALYNIRQTIEIYNKVVKILYDDNLTDEELKNEVNNMLK